MGHDVVHEPAAAAAAAGAGAPDPAARRAG